MSAQRSEPQVRWRNGTPVRDPAWWATRARTHSQSLPMRDCFYCGALIGGRRVVCDDCSDLPALDPQACVQRFGRLVIDSLVEDDQ